MAFLLVFILISLGTLSTSMEEEMRVFKIQKVSGVDESEERKALVLDKFRLLLGLGSLHQRNPHHGFRGYGSPAPSPAPAPAPVMRPIPLHPRRRPPRLSITLPHHSNRGHIGNQRGKEILVAVLVSVGAFVLLVFALVLVCFVNKQYKKRKRGKSVISQEIKGDKVSTEPAGFDLFYLDTLTSVMEPQAHLKEEDQEQGAAEAETVHVHECEELNNRHSADRHSPLASDQMSKIGSHSSGDDSFHSLCESNTSNNARLSNVSTSSFSDAAEGFSPKHPPPPPPPPPPPLRRPCCSLAHAKKAKSPSSVLQNAPPAQSPGSSSRSNETPASLKTGKVSTNIPPPPRPPSFMKGSSFKGPPPLPPSREQTPGQATLGNDGAPLPKLKPLHWDKVRAAPDRSMVWDKLRSSSFEFDEEMIESLFGYNLKSAFQNDEGKSKTPSPGKHVLEPKRLQNMTILSKALNVTVEQVCDALVQGDGLRLQELEALAKMEPTKEEEAKLSSYKGDLNELGLAEKLVKAMLNIPFAFQRIEAMLYRATFEDEVVHLRNSFSTLEEACKELRSSRLFLKLLEAVLKTGNRMNVGTIRGGAKAFKLDALLKLSDVKGTDGKTTLLHFVVQEIIRAEGIRMAGSIMGKINQNNKNKTTQEKEESYNKMGLDLVSGLTTELCNVKRTASIDLDVLATSVSNLSDGMAKLRKLALGDLSNDAMSSGFVCRMTGFMERAEKRLRELREHEVEVLRSVKEITEYFHGDVGKGEGNLLQIFIVVRDFLAMLDQVCRELRSLKVAKSPSAVALFQ